MLLLCKVCLWVFTFSSDRLICKKKIFRLTLLCHAIICHSGQAEVDSEMKPPVCGSNSSSCGESSAMNCLMETTARDSSNLKKGPICCLHPRQLIAQLPTFVLMLSAVGNTLTMDKYII